MKTLGRDQGFTLIELMVVVLIIGILVAIAIPVFNSAKANATQRACWSNQRIIEGAAHSYEASAGDLPPDIATLVNERYIQSTPLCPGDNASPYEWNADTGLAACTWATLPGPHSHYTP